MNLRLSYMWKLHSSSSSQVLSFCKGRSEHKSTKNHWHQKMIMKYFNDSWKYFWLLSIWFQSCQVFLFFCIDKVHFTFHFIKSWHWWNTKITGIQQCSSHRHLWLNDTERWQKRPINESRRKFLVATTLATYT